ncbi:glycosyltransferase family 2 protein [Lactobacillus equicursoris]|uniref:glycosyltransferase family 2 protein n=1 Tax=Lactobacillus equicursoris TaxID=420645 RepID=UPI00398ED077
MTTYNNEKCIKRYLDAIVKQKENHNIEVLIVDDGSKDDTVKICQEYSNKYNYIQIITHDNAGVSLSRNIGVRHSRGKWIMFIDSDDYILDDALNVISCYLNTDADVIF